MDNSGELRPGRRMGAYRIQSVERQGTGGAVLLAFDETRLRAVALHVARHSPGSVAGVRFLHRAGRLTTLDHPHLLRVYEARAVEGRAVGVTAVPAGRRLDAVLERGAMSQRRAMRLARQIAAAVQALEDAGADVPALRPDQVWIDGDRAVLDPLGAERQTSSPAAGLAALVTEMTGGAPPRDLTRALASALDGACFATAQFVRALTLAEARARRRYALLAAAAILAAAGIAAALGDVSMR